jgi:hypothetical protein
LNFIDEISRVLPYLEPLALVKGKNDEACFPPAGAGGSEHRKKLQIKIFG